VSKAQDHVVEQCAVCGCFLKRQKGVYASATLEGRSHATRHHYVAERFFGRSANRRGTKSRGLFDVCPWGFESQSGLFCYECHEELLHNPVLLPEDIAKFRELVKINGLSETEKVESREPIAGRIRLFHAVIARGLDAMLQDEKARGAFQQEANGETCFRPFDAA
jgi:hypothetical protein